MVVEKPFLRAQIGRDEFNPGVLSIPSSLGGTTSVRANIWITWFRVVAMISPLPDSSFRDEDSYSKIDRLSFYLTNVVVTYHQSMPSMVVFSELSE